ncbi:hypothetical protein, partial [Bifidobacterium favimelis]
IWSYWVQRGRLDTVGGHLRRGPAPEGRDATGPQPTNKVRSVPDHGLDGGPVEAGRAAVTG